MEGLESRHLSTPSAMTAHFLARFLDCFGIRIAPPCFRIPGGGQQ